MSKQKILLVDDEPQNLQLLRHTLKNDYDLIFAKSGEDALEQAVNQKPDLVLLDVMMPEMDGYEVCCRLKADPRCSDIPVIFCTAMNDETDEAMGIQLGAVDYITKPLRPAVVRIRAKSHLALSNQQRAFREQIKIQHHALITTRLQSLQMLGRAAEFKDNETGLHVIRMSHYSQLLAKAYGWHEEASTLMLHAAPMHDIGKIGTPDYILRKPGELNDEERAIMQQHPEIGARIIGEYAQESELFEMAAIIAMTHHEKWDGTGYPRGLTGENIPPAGRIVAVADIFDALTSRRPYKKPWSVEEAVTYLNEQAGKYFEPLLVKIFIDQMPEVLAIQARWREDAV